MDIRILVYQKKSRIVIVNHNPALKKLRTCQISGKKLWGLPQGGPVFYNVLINRSLNR